jgi:hypothetical protein
VSAVSSDVGGLGLEHVAVEIPFVARRRFDEIWADLHVGADKVHAILVTLVSCSNFDIFYDFCDFCSPIRKCLYARETLKVGCRSMMSSHFTNVCYLSMNHFLRKIKKIVVINEFGM